MIKRKKVNLLLEVVEKDDLILITKNKFILKSVNNHSFEISIKLKNINVSTFENGLLIIKGNLFGIIGKIISQIKGFSMFRVEILFSKENYNNATKIIEVLKEY